MVVCLPTHTCSWLGYVGGLRSQALPSRAEPSRGEVLAPSLLPRSGVARPRPRPSWPACLPGLAALKGLIIAIVRQAELAVPAALFPPGYSSAPRRLVPRRPDRYDSLFARPAPPLAARRALDCGYGEGRAGRGGARGPRGELASSLCTAPPRTPPLLVALLWL